MRNILILFALFLSISTLSAQADKKSEKGITQQTFKVSGNCEMCEARIEKAAKKVAGVKKADWNVDTKVMTVAFNPNKTSVADIQAAIAKVGHDNASLKADSKVYDKLPGCCQYRD